MCGARAQPVQIIPKNWSMRSCATKQKYEHCEEQGRRLTKLLYPPCQEKKQTHHRLKWRNNHWQRRHERRMMSVSTAQHKWYSKVQCWVYLRWDDNSLCICVYDMFVYLAFLCSILISLNSYVKCNVICIGNALQWLHVSCVYDVYVYYNFSIFPY